MNRKVNGRKKHATLTYYGTSWRTGDVPPVPRSARLRPDGRAGLHRRYGERADARLYGREAVGHRVGRPARDQVKEGVARLAQHLELELDLAVQ